MSPDDPRHGTYAGYNAHRYQGVEMCDPCREAARNYVRAHRANRDLVKTQQERARNRARNRALWRLAEAHPEEFRRLALDEMRNEAPLRPVKSA